MQGSYTRKSVLRLYPFRWRCGYHHGSEAVTSRLFQVIQVIIPFVIYVQVILKIKVILAFSLPIYLLLQSAFSLKENININNYILPKQSSLQDTSTN